MPQLPAYTMIMALLNRAAQTEDAEEALRFAQAALSAAHAQQVLQQVDDSKSE